MKTLDKILICIGIFIGLFIIAMIVLFCIFQSIPDTLVIAVLGSGGTECVLCALITISKFKNNVPTNTEDTQAIEE